MISSLWGKPKFFIFRVTFLSWRRCLDILVGSRTIYQLYHSFVTKTGLPDFERFKSLHFFLIQTTDLDF